jgi:hypothetical protein
VVPLAGEEPALPGQFLVMRLSVNPQVLAMLHALAAAKSGRDIW